MSRVARPGVFSVALTLALLPGSFVQAQTTKETAPAPLPAQIISAKKVFIANAGHESNLGAYSYSGGIDRTFNQFYSAMKSWGRFEFVTSPADCDLVFEIRFTNAVVGGSSVSPMIAPQFRLKILDPKMHIVLWAFTEHVEWARMQGNRDKNFDQSLGRIVADVKNLVTPPAIDTNK
jgi:hypothetical protein